MSRANRSRWDWDSFYERRPPPRNQVKSGKRLAGLIERFIDTKRLNVTSVADVGCGPATSLFELARRNPRCEFFGYDISEVVLGMDRQKAENRGLYNLHFGFARLPHTAIRRRFSIVLCIATLHYVGEPEQAVRHLYSLVNPGGYLIFNYPNRAQRAATIREAKEDPVVKRRFELVIQGGNLLSCERIKRVLDKRPRSFWQEVGEPARRLNPCVIVAR